MTFYLSQFYIDQDFSTGHVIEKVVCTIYYIYFFKFTTHF